jgi:hypothetical protein
MSPRSPAMSSWPFNCVRHYHWLPLGPAPRYAGQRRRLEALHARVLAGDDRAVEEICRLLLAAGQRIVRTRRPTADLFTIEDAVLDAVATYLRRPERFDPPRSGLLTWISLAAVRHVDDQRQREDARKAAEAVVASETRQAPSRQWPPMLGIKLVLTKAATSRRERKFLAAWLRHRSFNNLVHILGISDVSAASQIQEVRRLQERLRLRMKRIARQIRQESPAGRRRRS